MKSCKRPLLISSALAVLLSCGNAYAAPSADAASAAKIGLASLKDMANAQSFASFGFKSASEVSKAKLGAPIAVYMIEYDKLKALAPTTDPQTVLRDLNQQLFPVYVRGRVRAAITVSKAANGTWSVVSVGDAEVIKLLDSAKATHAKASGKKHRYKLIKIPALYQMFLAHTDGSGKLHFVTVHQDKALGSAKKGDSRTARSVLNLLTAKAKKAKLTTKRRK